MISRLLDLISKAVTKILTTRLKALRSEYRNEEEQLAHEIATAIGIRDKDVEIDYIQCKDGTVIPTIAIYTDMTPAQQQAVTRVLDSLTSVKANVRADGRMN